MTHDEDESWGLAEQVYAIVRLIPPGEVATYGDVAELLGTGPRMVGRIMSTNDEDDLPWWRIVNVQGAYPENLAKEAVPHWLAEGIVPRPGTSTIRVSLYRTDLAALADAAEEKLGVLPGAGEIE